MHTQRPAGPMRAIVLVYAGLLVVGALGVIAMGVYNQTGFVIITVLPCSWVLWSFSGR